MVARTRQTRNPYQILVENPSGKIPAGRPRRRKEDNFKMWGCGMDSSGSRQRLVNTVMNIREIS